MAKFSKTVSQISQNPGLSLDEAIKQGIARGNRRLRDVRVWWIKEERVSKGGLTEYQVNMRIGFVIDE